MPRTGVVNYHVHSAERQAYHIDADGIEGKIVSPEHAITEVSVFDEREEVLVEFGEDSDSIVASRCRLRSVMDND